MLTSFPRSLAAIALSAVLLLRAPVAEAGANVLFILDASGSMWAKVDNQPKIVIARKAMKDVLKDIPPGTKLGLMSYGHRRKGDCGDIEVIMPVGSAGAAEISKKIDALQPKGSTPIAEALRQSAGAFTGVDGGKMIVLVTDGAEECNGDPCAAAKELAAKDIDVHINVVGFNLGDKERKAVQCVADEGHGKYYDAKDSKALKTALAEVRTQVADATPPAPPPPPPSPPELNLLSPAQGGQLVAAPGEGWGPATSGKDKDEVGYCSNPAELIYSFKNEQPATFSKFEILVPSADGGIVKNFELLAADDSASGTYRSLGTFSTQDMKMIKDPYQAFTFPGATAKYVKVRLTSNYGVTGAAGCVKLNQIRLIGKPSDAPAAVAPEKSTDVNLLLPSEGGQLLAAPGNGWEGATSGKEADSVSICSIPAEIIYGFKNEGAATFSKFKVLIPHADGGVPRDFELLAADDSPTGTYRSLGKFTTQDLRMIASPYQEFVLPEITAKYLKLRLTASYGVTGAAGCVMLTQIGLMGKLATAPAAAPAAAEKPSGVNLLSPAQGGQLIAAPGDGWAGATTGKDTDGVGICGFPAEVVYAFKDEKPGTFSRFEILIPHADGGIIKDFELLAADDSPTGTYRSLGAFTTQDMVMVKSPYQGFTFPETTAKYLKLRLTSAYGVTGAAGCTQLTQIRLIGKQ